MKNMKKLLAGVCLCFLALIFAPGVQGEAAKKPTCVKKQTAYVQKMTPPQGDAADEDSVSYMFNLPTSYIFIKNLSSGAKITNLKSSNKKIVATSCVNGTAQRLNAIHLSEYYDPNSDEDYEIKPGDKTTISFTVIQNKKKYNLSCIVTLKRAPSIFKSFKIGGKNYTSEVNAYVYPEIAEISGSKVKISWKMRSGYKVDKIYVDYSNGKYIKVKNNQTISAKNIDHITVYYSTTKKPANYKKPSKWTWSKVASPLQEYVSISVGEDDE